jgi:hypothetical protein
MNSVAATILIILSCVALSCNLADSNARKIRQLNPSCKFIKDIPKDRRTAVLRKTERAFGLDSLDNGFDSIQIRIWYGCALDGERLIVLSNKNGRWMGEMSDGTYYDSLPRVLAAVQPTSAWEQFIKKLFDLQLLSLPAVRRFGAGAIADGCGVTIEIATKSIYRFYHYDNPDLYQNNHWQAKKMMEILQLVNKELRIKNWWPSEDKIK